VVLLTLVHVLISEEKLQLRPK